MAATLQCTLHRATAKQPLPPPPPIVLTLAGGGVTERTEEYTEFKEGQASLGETVLSLKCELVPHGSGKGYHKKEVFLAIKEAGLGGHRTLGMAKLDAADMRYLSDGGRGRGSSLRTTLLLGTHCGALLARALLARGLLSSAESESESRALLSRLSCSRLRLSTHSLVGDIDWPINCELGSMERVPRTRVSVNFNGGQVVRRFG